MNFSMAWYCVLAVVVVLLPFTPEAVPVSNADKTSASSTATTKQTTRKPVNYDDEAEAEWKAFRAKFRVQNYTSEDEEIRRKGIFMENLKNIRRQNDLFAKGTSSFKTGTNQFSDLSLEEYNRMVNGFKPGNPTLSSPTAFSTVTNGSNATSSSIPSTVDWRTQGYVTPVKNQGQCGSCWSFSVTGALEGQWYRSKGTLVSLSEQNLLDCSRSYGTNGCNGGWQDYAYNYIKANGGIDTESSYPYKAVVQNRCRYSSYYIGAKITGYVSLPAGNELALQQAVATVGPISVSIDANHPSFQNYLSGIYYEPACTTNLNHAVLVVGYGTQNGLDYWIVKNSWGTSWGMSGYVLMSRNQNNQCGIANYATYPTV